MLCCFYLYTRLIFNVVKCTKTDITDTYDSTLVNQVKMTSKLPKATLSLKQFMLRQEVLKLYRDIFRTVRLVPDESTRRELKEWARTDFRNNMHHSDEAAIKAMLFYGKKSLQDLEKSLALSRS